MKPNISELYKNNEKTIMTEGNKDKACVLSDQFSRMFIEEPEGDTPTAAPRNGRDIDSINITKEKINKVLQRLKINKSPGPDGIHPRVVKEMREELLEPLRILFNSSLEEGIVPEDWKNAHITAIFKKGN